MAIHSLSIHWIVAVALVAGTRLHSLAQEQIDQADATGQGAIPAGLTVRARVVEIEPETKLTRIHWRRGGEGLGGEVTRGGFAVAQNADIPVQTWSDPLLLSDVAGRAKSWSFVTFTVALPGDKNKETAAARCVVELEFAERGKVVRTIREPSPKGATVGVAIPGGLFDGKGAVDLNIAAQIQGLSAHAKARREKLEQQFKPGDPLPKQFGIIGHLGGYGEGVAGKGGGAGYGVRHCNPEILADEAKTLRLLGVNGLVGSLRPVEVAGVGDQFRRIYWGGPGSGSPMAIVQKGKGGEPNGCPFDPVLQSTMQTRVSEVILEHRQAHAEQSWALWTDEIGVFVKEHMNDCPRCAVAFREYLKSNQITPAMVGNADWEAVAPYPIWRIGTTANAKGEFAPEMSPVPREPEAALHYYYTYRFMTFATAQVFPVVAHQFRAAGIPLYAMQGPTPSWNGASLDWHEFYDTGANRAAVWETSNRDPRAWQWESYLADIMRGIARKQAMPIGTLVKPHRGAIQQRMLAAVTRGATVLEWYTYGPDYAKGDSFSQSPELLVQVAQAARFLGKGEEYLYGAKFGAEPEVAFVSPRSSEIWSKASELGITPFENAKWVYLALQHAHVPVNILSERQLAEEKLSQYKVIYISGPNLRNDAAKKVMEWVKNGGILWTDALGLARDEANQPADALSEFLPSKSRDLETWGSVEPYKAVDFKPLTERNVPPHAGLSWKTDGVWGTGQITAAIAREPLPTQGGDVIAKFTDGAAAVRSFPCGNGKIIVVGMWAGLTYSAKVRRADYDMSADYDPTVRALIAAPAILANITRPAIPSEPLVEAVYLKANKDQQRSVALINWRFAKNESPTDLRLRQTETLTNVRIDLPGIGAIKSVRSLAHGPLRLVQENGVVSVTLPRLNAGDLLVIE